MNHFYAVGVMTGTSCDGADFALLKILLDQNKKISHEFLVKTHHAVIPFALRTRLLSAQAGLISVRAYGALTRDYSLWLTHQLFILLKRWHLNPAKTILGIHGQTLWHAPPQHSPSIQKPGFSIQMIDGCLIAQRTGFVVISCFRQPDLAWGGQGAPLVPYYHWLKAHTGKLGSLPLAIHNIGGISNLTYVPKDSKKILAFDTGPGNVLIDAAVSKLTKNKQKFDRNGSLAKQGTIHIQAIKKLANHEYFKSKPPKSTGKELFNSDFLKRFPSKGIDLIADTTAFTAYTMALAYKKFVISASDHNFHTIYCAGGGAKNSYLITLFRKFLFETLGHHINVKSLPPKFLPPQFVEAMAFGRLAAEAFLGNKTSLPQVTGAQHAPHGAAIFQAASYNQIFKRFFS